MNIIYGTNTVRSALEIGSVKKLFLVKDYSNQSILDLAKKLSVKIVYLEKAELNNIAKGNNQGIAAQIKNIEPIDLTSFLESTRKVENPLIVILDNLNDPHNFGAILRSADIFNVTGIIYKKNNQVGLNDTVAKVSCGAINYVKCVEVTNLNQTIKTLKKEGFFVYGLDGEAKYDLKSIPKDGKTCIVVGSEGFGISRLVKENCDMLVKIPMQGHINCLNASVACSIVLYQIRN